jgi:hypothetical protein
MPTISSASHSRLRLLSLVQQRVIAPDDERICPPLTDEEREWLGLAPRKLLAEAMAGDEGED